MTPIARDPLWPRADMWLAGEDPEPDIMVVGVPSSTASLSPSRADLTPGAVRERLPRFSTYHSEYQVDFGDIPVADIGNWAVSELGMNEMPAAVEELARHLPDTPLTLFLGGDNAITRPLVKARSEELIRVGVITFDAHHDVRSLVGGPSNGSPIRGLVEEDGLPGANIHQIGIHSFANSAQYRAYCDKVGISVTTVRQVEEIGVEDAVGNALTSLAERCDTIYVDVDIDVLDRAFAPACPGAQPGGMTVRQLANGVRLCGAHPKVSAIDFVEVDASVDPNGLTLDSMAQLVLTAVVGFAARQ